MSMVKSVERHATPGMQRQAFKDYLWREQSGRCSLCGDRMRRDGDRRHPLFATIDHVKAVGRGGTNHEDNLRLAHLRCNAAKGCGTAV